MSPTEVFLCYGIFVSGQSLIAATATWRKIVRTDALLDAIKHKRTKTGMKAIVYAVPPEIWDMVEQHLFDLERPVVVSDMVKEILCRDCITQLEDTQETLTFKHLNARLSYKFSKACESCKSSADQVRGLHDAVDLQVSTSLHRRSGALVEPKLTLCFLDDRRAVSCLLGTSSRCPAWITLTQAKVSHPPSTPRLTI